MTDLSSFPAAQAQPLLDIRGLGIRFGAAGQPAVNRLDLHLHGGEALALVGESGSGKSTTAMAIMRLLAPGAVTTGQIHFENRDLLTASPRAMRQVRGNRIGMIFQEPMNALNPVHRIGDQIVEALRTHLPLSRAAARTRMLDLLDRVQLPDSRIIAQTYPHRLSGGQRQRVMIAMAIACDPVLLIADEPTTALDATIQADILDLLDGLRRETGMALLLITHDLPIVERWTDRVMVLHHGEMMEALPSDALFERARHPYTRGLIGASLGLDADLHHTQRLLPEIRVTWHDGLHDFSLGMPECADPVTQPAFTGADLLEVSGLSVDYRSGADRHRVVQEVSLRVKAGETLGIVGESGSGKSTLCKAIARLIPSTQGGIRLKGEDITSAGGERLRALRRDVQLVFQDPSASLNPRQTVGDTLDEVLMVHGEGHAPARRRASADMLDHVGLPVSALARFPHEFSGGQRQRIGIARALILKPSLVLFDEPVSALDTSVQAQVLNLLTRLKRELGLTYLFVSHDLAVIQYMSDQVIVMREGRIVEQNDRLGIWQSPRHAYTRQLIEAARAHQPAQPILA